MEADVPWRIRWSTLRESETDATASELSSYNTDRWAVWWESCVLHSKQVPLRVEGWMDGWGRGGPH
eukprot:364746-Chlamydomonas_euryale.AAC.5